MWLTDEEEYEEEEYEEEDHISAAQLMGHAGTCISLSLFPTPNKLLGYIPLVC